MLAHAHSPPSERAQPRPPLEVADIVRAHGEDFVRAHVLTPEQHAVLRDIARCRTAALGGHVDLCSACGHIEAQSYNSCRNRHCPKCQGLAQLHWVEERMERMLPTHSFHVVFTLPRELRRLALANRSALFNMLFACAAETLHELGRDDRRLGGDLGITSVLHTWTRDLRFHPHVHSIVTGGGLSRDGQRWISADRAYLFPVRVLGDLFRGKMLDALRRAYALGKLKLVGPAAPLADRERWRRLLEKLHDKRWVVYCKPPFGDNQQVFRYLGHYTHRVGLSNQRLVALDEHSVTFRTRGDGKVTVTPDEFLRRFVLHVLPKGFVKIRHHGLFAPGNIHTKLAAARKLLSPEAPTAETAPATTPAPAADAPAAPAVDPAAPTVDAPAAPALKTEPMDIALRPCSRCGETALVRYLVPVGSRPPPPTDTS